MNTVKQTKIEYSLHTLNIIVLLFAVVIAWYPLLNTYWPVNDDYTWMDVGIGMDHFHNSGVWRIVGNSLATLSITDEPVSHGLLAILTHSCLTVLFYLVCQQLFSLSLLSFNLALIGGIFPWGYQAMTWAAAYTYMIATAFFWANLLTLIKFGPKKNKQKGVFIASFVFSLLSLLSNECLIFALVISGSYIWFLPNKPSITTVKNRFKMLYSGWAPLIAACCYLALYILRKPVINKQVSLNPASVISVYYHQYSNLDVFQPWLDPTTREFLFYSVSFQDIFVLIFLFILLILGLWTILKSSDRNDSNTKPTIQLLGYIILLLLGASAIYALGGGYSLDTRKKYALIPLLLLLTGWLWCYFLRQRIKISTKRIFGMTLLVIVLGVSTTWLNVNIWSYEAMRYNRLADFLRKKQFPENIRIEWVPDLYSAWPTMSRSWGFRLDEQWVLNMAVKFRGGAPVDVVTDNDAKTVRFDPSSNGWMEIK